MAFMLTYPFDESIATQCLGQDGYGHCYGEMYGDTGDCNWPEFRSTIDWQALYLALAGKCDVNGVECMEGCAEAIEEFSSQYTCMQGKMQEMVLAALGMNLEDKTLANMYASCMKVAYDPTMKHDHDHDDDKCEGAVCDGTDAMVVSLGLLVMVLGSHLYI